MQAEKLPVKKNILEVIRKAKGKGAGLFKTRKMVQITQDIGWMMLKMYLEDRR